MLIEDNDEYEYIRVKKKSKTYVNLDITANCLEDLINIVNKYKFDSKNCYNINLEVLHNIKDELIELNNFVGLDKIKKSIFEQLIYFLQNLENDDFKHIVIYGPPGTGKTEIAKIIGKLYSKIGILKKKIFKSATRCDLIAEYLGQTAIKTKNVIKSALDGVLFIDEAYSLGSDDLYSQECLNTLCYELSENKKNLMVIIAGYKKELDENFFTKNPGLNSRFIWRFEINNYSCKELMNILKKKINDDGWKIDDNILNEDWFERNMNYFTNYGRDMEILFFKIKIIHCNRVFGKLELFKNITLEDLNDGFNLFIDNSEVKQRNIEVKQRNIEVK